MELSIVIPAYNEASKIERDLSAVLDYLKSKGPSEIIVVDDGSRDSTASVAHSFIERSVHEPHVLRLVSYGINRGKGYAVRYGVSQSKGLVVAFVDSGLCVPFSFLDLGIQQIHAGFDFAIASRRLPGALVQKKQSRYRRWGSVTFWHLMRAVMGIDVTDTQCGFKVYNGDVARKLFALIKTDGFMFDIEVLRLAKQLGFKGAEFPVEWSNDGDTRYHPVSGTWKNFVELAMIRGREIIGSPPS